MKRIWSRVIKWSFRILEKSIIPKIQHVELKEIAASQVVLPKSIFEALVDADTNDKAQMKKIWNNHKGILEKDAFKTVNILIEKSEKISEDSKQDILILLALIQEEIAESKSNLQ